MLDVKLIEFFWNNIEKREASECWNWAGGKNDRGFGGLFWAGKILGAHRLSWEIAYGHPGKLHVLHECDNRACCNPTHLFLGTHKENMEDMVAKGRNAVFEGILHPRSKLTESEVRIIRESPKGTKGLARQFNTTRSNLHCIRSGKSWTSLA